MRLYLTFGSTYGALRAEDLLREAGVACEIVPKPREIRGACGLAVRLARGDADHALNALERAHHPARQRVQLP